MKENQYFVFNVPRHKNLKYWVQYLLLVLMDIFFKVLFSLVRKRSFAKKYKISICAIFKNEASYLKEWLEYYLLLEVDHFYLYNNNSTDSYQEVLKPYIDKGIVTLIEWPEVPGQISAYKNWYENYRCETNWCSFLDLDEFLCPINEVSLKGWLDKHHKYPLYAIYWKVFGTSGKIIPDMDQLVIEQYTNCWDKFATATKIIYNTDYDIENFFTSMMHKFNVKFGKLSVPPMNIFGYFINHWEIHRWSKHSYDIQCNHYWSKSYREYQEKHKRGDAVWNDGKSVRTKEMFLWHEHYNRSKDYLIQRFLLELKMKMSEK